MDQLSAELLCRSLPRPARRGARGRATGSLRRARIHGTRYLLGRGSAQLLQLEGRAGIAFLDHDSPLVRAAQPSASCCCWAGSAATRVVLIDLPPDDASSCPPAPASRSCGRLRRVLGARTPALLAYARALATWRARQRHCGVCGSPTVPIARRPLSCVCTNPACAQRVLPAHRPGDHRAGERWRARAAGASGELAAAPLLDHRRLRRAGREPRGRRGARGAGGNRRRGAQRALPLLAAVAVPLLHHARLLRQRRRRAARCSVSGELEDARWFTREQVTSGEALAPPTQSISWRLIETWLKGAA